MSTNNNSASTVWRKEIFYQPDTLAATPMVLVSACLTGMPVRYDGKEKTCAVIIERLAASCQLLTLCPETAAGFPVPRPPVQLIQTDTSKPTQALGVNDKTLNVTDTLLHSAQQQITSLPAVLSGACLKSRSPSCGHMTTPIHDISGSVMTWGSGIFARQLLHQRPWLAFSDEDFMHGCENYLWFLWRVFVNHDILTIRDARNLTAQITHYQQLLTQFDIKLAMDTGSLSAESIASQLQSAFGNVKPVKRKELLDYSCTGRTA